MTLSHDDLNRLGQPAILVVGDIILDRYIEGDVDRIAPEGPIPVLRKRSIEETPGGAANVAANLAAMGAKVRLAGIAGKDVDGRRLLKLVRAAGIDVSLIRSDERPTSVKTRFHNGGHILLRLDEEETHHLDGTAHSNWWKQLRQSIRACDLVLLSDYNKGVLSPTLLEGIFKLCHEKNIPVLVDPKGTDYARYKGATLVTPNRNECGAAAGTDVTNEDSLLIAARKLLRLTGCREIVVTRGPDGMSWITRKAHQHRATVAQSVYDVSGAGDSSIAALAMAWAANLETESRLEIANLAGGISVSRLGAHPVSRDEMHEALHDQEGGKILDWKHLAGRRAQYKRDKRRVVLTTGCFDLLHSGHLSLLTEAKKQGDILVVGLNSDASVRRLKGPERPVADESQRAHLLAGFSVVDHVVVFDQDSPRKLIETLKPDIWVKGADYATAPKGSIFARELAAVKKHGGILHLARFVEGRSTTQLVNKIRNT